MDIDFELKEYEVELENAERDYGLNDNRTIRLVNEIAAKYIKDRQFDKAIIYIHKILSVNLTFFEKNDDLAKTYALGCKARFFVGQYENSLKFCNRGLSIVDDDELRYTFYVYKGILLSRLGQDEDSLDYFSKSISDYEKIHADDESFYEVTKNEKYPVSKIKRIERAYSEIASYYLQQVNHDESLKYYKRLFYFMKNQYDNKTDEKFVMIYNNASKVFISKGDSQTALIFALRAFSICGKLIDLTDKKNKKSYDVLVDTYIEIDDFEKKIEKVFSKNLKIKSSIYFYIGIEYFKRKDYYTALVNFYTAKDIMEKIYDNDNEFVLDVSNHIGYCLYELEEYDSAIDYFEEELETRRDYTVFGNKYNIKIYEKIVSCYKKTGEREKAFAMCQNTLDGAFKSEDYKTIEKVYNKVGRFYRNIGDYENALKTFGNLANTIKNEFLKKMINLHSFNEKISNLYIDIAITYYYKNEYVKSEKYLNKSLEYLKNDLSNNDLSLSNAYKQLCLFYKKIDNLEKALEYGIIVNDLNMKNPTNNSMNIVESLFTLGEIYYLQENYVEANNYLERCYNLYNKIGFKDSIIVQILNLLSLICVKSLNYKKALKYEMKLYDEYYNHGNVSETDYVNILESIAFLNYKLERSSESIVYYKKILDLSDTFDKDKKEKLYTNLGYAYEADNDFHSATSSYLLALSLLNEEDELYEEKVSNLYYDLYNCFYKIGNYSDALTYAQKLKDVYEDIYGVEDVQTFITYKDIANIYLMLEEYEKAQEFFYISLRICNKNKIQTQKQQSEKALIYFDLAKMFQKQIRLDEAISSYRNVIDIYENIDDLRNPIVKMCKREIRKLQRIIAKNLTGKKVNI